MKKSNESDGNGNPKIVVPAYSSAYDDVYSLVFCNFSALGRKAQVLTFKKHENGNAGRLEHINFILQASPHLMASAICPGCHKNTVTHFRVKDSRLVACCEKCKGKCGSAAIYPISFETLAHPDFQSNESQKQLKQLFKSVLGLPDNPEPQTIYSILKKSCISQN